jgi:hypothetical protein
MASAVNPQPLPIGISSLAPPLDPYKRRATSSSFTAPFPALISLSPSSNLPLTERRHHQAFPVVARPPRCRSSPGEAIDELPVPPSPFYTPAGELWRTGAAGGRASVSASPCPLSALASVHGGPSSPGRSTETWTRSTNYPLGNNSLFWKISEILQRGPWTFGKSTHDLDFADFALRPLRFSKINPRSTIFPVRSEIQKIFTKIVDRILAITPSGFWQLRQGRRAAQTRRRGGFWQLRQGCVGRDGLSMRVQPAGGGERRGGWPG